MIAGQNIPYKLLNPTESWGRKWHHQQELSLKFHIIVDQIISFKSTNKTLRTCMQKICKKKIECVKRDKIWVFRWTTKRSINAVSAWSVYMYVHQYEYAPPPSTVPTPPNPIHTRNMHPNNCSRTWEDLRKTIIRLKS